MTSKEEIKQYEENIRNYGSKIETLESFVEAVRKLPGMYIGNIGNAGYLGCIREIFQNAIDEAVKKESPCHYIKVTFDERNQMATIEDTGRGIPHGMIIKIYSSQHTSSNYTKQLGEYSSGVHGVGSGVALALAKKFIILSYQLGKAKRVEFNDGIPWADGEKNIECPKGRQGTTVIMTPAIDVLGPVSLKCKDVFDLVFRILPLTNIGDRIDFMGMDISGKLCMYEELVNKDGIITELILRTKSPLIKPIIFGNDTGTTKADIAFTYDASDLNSNEDIVSFSNFTPTLSGTHVQGFLDGLCNFFRGYMNKIYLGEKSKVIIVNNDIKTGLKAVVVAAHLHPVFVGQAKSILNNEDMGFFVRDITYKALESWAKMNSSEMQKLCKYFKEIAEIRMKSDDNKIKLSTKYENNLLTGKPKKYVQPSGNKELELVIVEGDSALGSAKNGRDNARQGLFPIRGKLPNAFTTTKAKFLNNEEVASIITIIGGGYGKNFDITRVKFDKVICMADADPDGAHINTLLLRMFLLYMPELITSGKLYRAVPPLYGIKTSRGMKYFSNTFEFTKYLQSLFSNSYSLCTVGNIKLTNTESTGLFLKNINYTSIIDIISNTFAVDKELLEDIMLVYAPYAEKISATNSNINNIDNENSMNGIPFYGEFLSNDNIYILKNFNLTEFKKNIEKKYRFVKVKAINGLVIIEGLVNSKYQYVVLNDKFVKSCGPIIDILKSNDNFYYNINGERVSLYKLMNIFEKMAPNGLTRYKGLGEQGPEKLGESVLRPDSNRTLIRYTIEEIKQEIELIRYVDSDKSNLLKDIKVTKQDIE